MPTPILHAGVGVAALRAALRERLPWRAVLVAVGVAVAADVDILPGFLMGDPMRFHHGLTHSALFAIGLAALASRFEWGLDGVARRQRFWCLALVALSHVCFDLLNRDIPSAHPGDPSLPLAWPLPWRVPPVVELFDAPPVPPDPRLWLNPLVLRVALQEFALGVGLVAVAHLLPSRQSPTQPAAARLEAES